MIFEMKELPWLQCKEICEGFYKDNDRLSPYQEYSFLDLVRLGRKETNPFCTVGYLEKNYVLYKNGKPISVFPLYINRLRKIIVLRGFFSIIAHLDFIYDKAIDKESFEYAFEFFSRKYKGYIFKLERISENSFTYEFLKNKYSSEDVKKSICVSISFAEGYEEWFSTLKKSYKQDIRSGYNRLRTDAKDYKFEFDKFSAPNTKANLEILKLYSRRACEHSGIRTGIKSDFIQWYLRLTKKSNPFNIALEKSTNYIGGRIYIDSNMVAYCQALLANDGRIIVPKLSIDLDYKRYNLGGLLINEMIKHACEEIGLERCRELDLSRGDERYKYDYGGTEHYNYDYCIRL